MVTAMAGYAMAPGAFDPLTFALCTLGTGLTSAAANTINQVGVLSMLNALVLASSFGVQQLCFLSVYCLGTDCEI